MPAALLFLFCPLIVLLSGLFMARRERFERVLLLWASASASAGAGAGATRDEKVTPVALAAGRLLPSLFGIDWTALPAGRRAERPATTIASEACSAFGKPTTGGSFDAGGR